MKIKNKQLTNIDENYNNNNDSIWFVNFNKFALIILIYFKKFNKSINKQTKNNKFSYIKLLFTFFLILNCYYYYYYYYLCTLHIILTIMKHWWAEKGRATIIWLYLLKITDKISAIIIIIIIIIIITIISFILDSDELQHITLIIFIAYILFSNNNIYNKSYK
jgi:hypothetical protein